MTQLATLTVNIKGDNSDVLKKIADTKNALNNVGGAGGGGSGGSGGGAANQGFFGSKSIFGINGRDFFRDIAAGFVIDRAMNGIKNFATQATNDLAKVRAGLETTGEAFENTFAKVPVVGPSFEAGRSIRELFSGEKPVDQINTETANIDHLTAYYRKSADERRVFQVRANEEIIRSQERVNALGVEGPAREAVMIRNAQADKLRAIDEEAEKEKRKRESDAEAARHLFQKQKNQAESQIAEIDKNNPFVDKTIDPTSINGMDKMNAMNALGKATQNIQAINDELSRAQTEADRADAQKRLAIAKQTEAELTNLAVNGSEKRQQFLAAHGSAINQFSTGTSVNEIGLAAAEREVALNERLYDLREKIKVANAANAAILQREVDSTIELSKKNEDLIRARDMYATGVSISNISERINTEQIYGNIKGIRGTFDKSESERSNEFEASTQGLRKQISDLRELTKDLDEPENNKDYQRLRQKEEELDKLKRERDLNKSIRVEDERHAETVADRGLTSQGVGVRAGIQRLQGAGLAGQLSVIKDQFGAQIDELKYKMGFESGDDLKRDQRATAQLVLQERLAEAQARFNASPGFAQQFTPQTLVAGGSNPIVDLKKLMEDQNNILRDSYKIIQSWDSQ